jgi:hypothetical protein
MLSETDSLEKMLVSCGQIAKTVLSRCDTSASASHLHRAATLFPSVGAINPQAMRKLVLLPAPLGPSKPTISPSLT